MEFNLYKFNVTKWSDEEYQKVEKYLQESEKTKAKKFYHIIDAKRSVSSHLITKKNLCELFHSNNDNNENDNEKKKKIIEIFFQRTKENRPFWNDYNQKKNPCLNFNMSHSGLWGIVGICDNCVIGVDVQEMVIPGKDQSVSNFVKNLKSCFTFKEWCYITLHENLYGKVKNESIINNKIELFLNFLAKKEQLQIVKERFFTFWVLKEAFIKAIACGIYFELQRVEFCFNDSEVKNEESLIGKRPMLYVDGKKNDDLHFRVVQLDKSHLAGFGFIPVNYQHISQSFKNTLNMDRLEECELKRKDFVKKFNEVTFKELDNSFLQFE